jgi:hypothetical protein
MAPIVQPWPSASPKVWYPGFLKEEPMAFVNNITTQSSSVGCGEYILLIIQKVKAFLCILLHQFSKPNAQDDIALTVVLCFKKLNDAILNVHILFPDAKCFIDPRSAAVQKPEEYRKLDSILTISRGFICINRMKISCYFIFSIYVRLKIRLSVANISCHKDMISLAAKIYEELFNPIYPGIVRGACLILFPLYPFCCMLTGENRLTYFMFNAKAVKLP